MSNELDLSEAGVFGEPDVVRVQRVLFAARAWIAEQEGMASHGRALVAFNAHRLPKDRLEALVRCFERVLVHAPLEAMPALLDNLGEAGARVDAGLTLVAAAASDVRASADAHERLRPIPRGFALAELGADAPDDAVRAVQELQAAAGQVPLPGWYLRGAERRAVTLVLHDPAGRIAGAATACAAQRPGEVAALTGMPVCTCLREDARGRGVSSTLTGAALRAACERFGTRWLYGLVPSADPIALRMASRCGFMIHPGEGIALARPC